MCRTRAKPGNLQITTGREVEMMQSGEMTGFFVYRTSFLADSMKAVASKRDG
jgi:hypothetical protein